MESSGRTTGPDQGKGAKIKPLLCYQNQHQRIIEKNRDTLWTPAFLPWSVSKNISTHYCQYTGAGETNGRFLALVEVSKHFSSIHKMFWRFPSHSDGYIWKSVHRLSHTRSPTRAVSALVWRFSNTLQYMRKHHLSKMKDNDLFACLFLN